MKPYQPSNKVPNAGYKWLILSAALGGLAIGGLTFAVSRLIYLILIFPVAMGIAGGAVSVNAIRQGKVRNPLIGTVFAALTGCIIYGTLHAGDYWTFKQEASQDITHQLGSVDEANLNQLIDAYLQEETGLTGFLGYLNFAAKQGMSIGKVGQEGVQLNETFTWIYWLIEFALIEGLIIAIAYGAAQESFCESCDRWYGDRERVGNVPNRASENFLNFIKNDNFLNAGKLFELFGFIYNPSLEVHIQHCPDCPNSDVILTVSRASFDSKNNVVLTKVLQGAISQRQESQLLQFLNNSFSSNQGENPQSAEQQSQAWLLAQQERSTVSASDRFELHKLNVLQEAKLVEQLSKYKKVKEAYLVRKVVQYFPEKPFYVLGIIRRRSLIESEIAERELLNRLGLELELPGQIWIAILNRDKPFKQALQEVAGAAIYRR